MFDSGVSSFCCLAPDTNGCCTCRTGFRTDGPKRSSKSVRLNMRRSLQRKKPRRSKMERKANPKRSKRASLKNRRRMRLKLPKLPTKPRRLFPLNHSRQLTHKAPVRQDQSNRCFHDLRITPRTASGVSHNLLVM